MVIYLGAAIVGVALLGTGALIWKITRPPVEEETVAAAPVDVPTDEVDPNVISEEANPAAETNPVSPSVAKPATPKVDTTPAAKNAASNQAKGAAPPVAPPASLALLKTVKEWKQIEKFASFAVRPGLKCTKLTAYLAADAAGRKIPVRYVPPAATDAAASAPLVAPANDASAADAPAIAEPTPAAPAGSAKYQAAEPASFLFVEIAVTNPEATPRTYAGWNNGETSALLVDGAGKPFTLLPASATPGVKRLGAKEVQPGETIQDTLVFAVPPDADMLYRLALPKPAFTPKLSGAWAYEITGASLAELSAPAQGVAGDPAIAAPAQPAPAAPRSSTSIPIPGLHDVPPQQPQPQPAPAAPAQPEPEKKPMPTERIPIPGLTDVPENKPAGPKKPEEVPNLAPPEKK